MAKALTQDIEEWRAVAGYEGFYEVSSIGNVRSLPRLVISARRNQFHQERALRQVISIYGYPCVSLAKNGVTNAKVLVHRLVAAAFIPPIPGWDQVNHLDSNRANNRVENLEWCSPKGNMQHSARAGRMRHKLTHEMVRTIRADLAAGIAGTKIAAKLGIRHGIVYWIKNCGGWSHVS